MDSFASFSSGNDGAIASKPNFSNSACNHLYQWRLIIPGVIALPCTIIIRCFDLWSYIIIIINGNNSSKKLEYFLNFDTSLIYLDHQIFPQLWLSDNKVE